MKVVKILGTGCTNCLKLEKLVLEVTQEKKLDIDVQKVTAIPDIMAYGIMSTPGLVIDEKVVISGRVPSKVELEKILTA